MVGIPHYMISMDTVPQLLQNGQFINCSVSPAIGQDGERFRHTGDITHYIYAEALARPVNHLFDFCSGCHGLVGQILDGVCVL